MASLLDCALVAG